MTKNYKIYVTLATLISLFFLSNQSFAQGGFCNDITPFCSNNEGLIFKNCSLGKEGCNLFSESGPNYDCLEDTSFPGWFFLKVGKAGTFDFKIVQNTQFDNDGNPIGFGLDVDFIAWGPFDESNNLCDYTKLQSPNQIGCSFLPDVTESLSIPNAKVGEIYILVITNFSQFEGFIQLQQTNIGKPGSGATDCSIVSTKKGCNGETVDLDIFFSNVTNYLWEYDDGSGYTEIFNGNFPSIKVDSPGLYRATSSFEAASSRVNEFNVEFFPKPITVNEPLDIFECGGNLTQVPFNLTSNAKLILGEQNTSLFKVEFFDILNSLITTPEAYFIENNTSEKINARISDLSGSCTSESSFIITARPLVAGNIPDYVICDLDNSKNEIVNLSDQFDSFILNNQVPSKFSITYYTSKRDAELKNSALQNNYLVNSNITTIYSRIENIDDPSCFDISNAFTIYLQSFPVINKTIPPLIGCDNDLDKIETFDLTEFNPILNASGIEPNNFEISYYESKEDAEIKTNALNTTYQNKFNPQILYARIEKPIINTELDSCFKIIELRLNIVIPPQLNLEDQYRICTDNNGVLIPEIEGTPSPAIIDTRLASENMKFVWFYNNEQIENSNTPSITAFNEGVYEVMATNLITGCFNSAKTSVKTSSAPTTYNADFITDIFDSNKTILATAFGNDDSTYIYQLNDGDFQNSGRFENVSFGDHTITIKDSDGCGSVSIHINGIEFINFFTPNQDGIFDTWNIRGFDEIDPSAIIHIFDRYGKLLKRISVSDKGWNGTYKNKHMPSDEYWFKITYNQKGVLKHFSSHFSLKR